MWVERGDVELSGGGTEAGQMLGQAEQHPFLDENTPGKPKGRLNPRAAFYLNPNWNFLK